MTAGRLVFPALRWRPDSGFSHEAATIATALEFGAGGFLLSGGTADAVFELCRELRAQAGRALLIAADLERGPGQQVAGLDELPPPLALASLNDSAVLRGAGVLTALEALSVGINWILAPVLDLDVEPENPSVLTRAFGSDPDQVSAAGAAWIVGCEAGGALACAKHFPGCGRGRADSHDAVPVVTADATLLQASDLKPFEAAVAAGVSSVLMAHVAFPALDPSGAPATFSAPMLRLLRDELGFSGLVASAALRMAGAPVGGSPVEAALAALRAGVDLLLHPEDPAAVAAALTRAAARDPVLGGRVDTALERYAAALEAVPMDAPPERLPPAGSSVAAADWLLSAPLLRGEEPALNAPVDLVIVDEEQPAVWPASPNTFVRQALVERGVAVAPGGCKVVLAFAEPRPSSGRAGFGVESTALLAREAPDAALVVLFGHPRLLDQLPGNAPVLLAWHRQRLMQEAVARWLTGHLG